jgi:hypothetical protein
VTKSDALERGSRLLRTLDREHAGEAERVLHVRDRGSPQHDRPLEHHRLTPPLARPFG